MVYISESNNKSSHCSFSFIYLLIFKVYKKYWVMLIIKLFHVMTLFKPRFLLLNTAHINTNFYRANLKNYKKTLKKVQQCNDEVNLVTEKMGLNSIIKYFLYINIFFPEYIVVKRLIKLYPVKSLFYVTEFRIIFLTTFTQARITLFLMFLSFSLTHSFLLLFLYHSFSITLTLSL